jgi:CheY-like chemotaxis protein
MSAPHVLLAEDFPEFMRRLFALLEPLGLNLSAALNGRDAIDHVRDPSRPLDLLITDLDMPFKTGWHVIEAAWEHRGRHLPVIMQTGEASYPWVQERARSLGVPLIDKVDIDARLVATVREVLRLP